MLCTCHATVAGIEGQKLTVNGTILNVTVTRARTHTHTHTQTDSHKTLDLEYVPGSQEWSTTPSTAEGVDSVQKKLQAAKI